MEYKITNSYIHSLQYAYSRIERRGILFDAAKLFELRCYVDDERRKLVDLISQAWGEQCYLGGEDGKRIIRADLKSAMNLNSTLQIMNKFRQLGIKIPTVAPSKDKRNKGETEWRESVNELALLKIYAATGLPEVQALIKLRELSTMMSRYINSYFVNNIYYSNYNVCGTVTGRRSSQQIIFGWGGNGQNWPKHSEIGLKFRECAIARPGKIFINVDQVSAEEWPVSALSQNMSALDELSHGINRHRKLASFIFNKPESMIDKGGIEYYLGKKSRHANNYGMQCTRMSESLAAEGYSFSKEACREILTKVHNFDPSVQDVFHKYIKEQIGNSRKLVTPFGRERIFFGFRQNSQNYDLWNDAYSWIPQSTVGDNTGFAVHDLELSRLDSTKYAILGDSHDSILQEVPFRVEDIEQCIKETAQVFDRDITFNNDIKVNIPVEVDLGFNLRTMKGFKLTGDRSLWRVKIEEALHEMAKTE